MKIVDFVRPELIVSELAARDKNEVIRELAAHLAAHALPPAGSTWVTRPRPHIDRIASAWLIKRFIDPQARFVFADETDAARRPAGEPR